MANPNAAQSLYRLTQHLRGLLKTMAGEESEPFHNIDPDYDGASLTEADIQELYTLLVAATEQNERYPGLEGRQDWAVERECEITRLENENHELRRILGIDEASLTERGITVEHDRVESVRHSTFLSSSTRRTTSNESYTSRLGYWENSGQPTSPALQRPMDLQPGMRFGPQARRSGIFGAGQQRGGFLGGSGRGVSLAVASSPSIWSSQSSNSTPLADRQSNYTDDPLVWS